MAWVGHILSTALFFGYNLQSNFSDPDQGIKAIAGTRNPADLGTKFLTRTKIIELLQILGTTLTTFVVQRARASSTTPTSSSAVLWLTLLALSQIAEGLRRALLVQAPAWASSGSPDSAAWKDEVLEAKAMSSGEEKKEEKGKKGGDGKGMKEKEKEKGGEDPHSEPTGEDKGKGKGEKKGKGEGT